MKTLPLLATAAMLGAAPALGQTRPDAGPAQPQVQPSAPPDRAEGMSALAFLHAAAMGDRYGIAAGRLAEERSQNREVRQFAREMVRDHTRTTQELRQIMQQMPPGAADAPISGVARDPAASPRAGSSAPGGPATGGGRGATSGAMAAPGEAEAQQGLDQRHAEMLRQLQRAQGAEFDRLFVQQQVQAHHQALTLFGAYAQQGTNALLRRWAAKVLPDLQDRLRRAQELQRSVSG